MPYGPNSLFVRTVDTRASSTRQGSASGSTCGGSDSPAALKAAYEMKAAAQKKLANAEAARAASELKEFKRKLADAESARTASEMKAALAEFARRAVEKNIAAAVAAKAAAEKRAHDLEVKKNIAESTAEKLQEAAALRASSANNASLQEERVSRGELVPVWSCQIDDDKWVAYDDIVASKLETAYQARKQPGTHQSNNQPTWPHSGNTYAVNWEFMVQMNAHTKKVRPLRRELVRNTKSLSATEDSGKQWAFVQEETLPGNVSRSKILASSL